MNTKQRKVVLFVAILLAVFTSIYGLDRGNFFFFIPMPILIVGGGFFLYFGSGPREGIGDEGTSRTGS